MEDNQQGRYLDGSIKQIKERDSIWFLFPVADRIR